jgi:hypothetical protein
MTCRKAHAAAFNPFAVFAKEQVVIDGDVASWESSAGYLRQFCPACGSRVANINGAEVEVSLGSFDDPGVSTPHYECWIVRREHWLTPLAVPQYEGNKNDQRDIGERSSGQGAQG